MYTWSGNGRPTNLPKLAVFVPELTAGGAQQALLTLCPNLVETYGPIDLLLATAEGPLIKRVPPEVNIIDLASGYRPNSRLALGARTTYQLSRYLCDIRPNILLSTLTGANLVSIVARRLSATSCRLVLREANTPENMQRISTRLAVRFLYSHADAVIAVSAATRQGLLAQTSVTSAQVHTIPNAVDANRLAHLASEPPQHPWFRPGTPPVIVSAGRLVPQKDHAMLINAIRYLHPRRPVRLLIIGEGPLRAELEAQIRQLGLSTHVRLTGVLHNPYPYIAHASAFALSSRWEGMPNVLLEALALGTPVISTNCPSGPAEILGHPPKGALAPVGNPKRFSLVLARLLDNPPAPDSLRRRAEEFSPARIAASYTDVLGR